MLSFGWKANGTCVPLTRRMSSRDFLKTYVLWRYDAVQSLESQPVLEEHVAFIIRSEILLSIKPVWNEVLEEKACTPLCPRAYLPL
jgi:hypothetical protein